MKKKILLIGHRGCLGTAIINQNKKLKIFKIINPSSKALDITNFKKTKNYIVRSKPNLIINAASLVGINQCEENPILAYRINTLSVLNLAKICDEKKITFIHTSTHAVFDGQKKKPYSEKDEVISNNIYACTKFAAENFVKSINKKYFIFRFPTMYGRRKNKLLGFVDKVILKLKNNQDLYIAYDKIDSPSYSNHIAHRLLKLILTKKYGIYHLANSGKVSYYTFVKEIKKLMNSKSKIKPVKDSYFKSSALKPLNTSMISNKIKPLQNWKKAIKEFIMDEVL